MAGIFGTLSIDRMAQKSAVRYFGIVPFVVCISAMILAPRPDLLVTGDGKHLALINAKTDESLLRAKAGDFIPDMLL